MQLTDEDSIRSRVTGMSDALTSALHALEQARSELDAGDLVAAEKSMLNVNTALLIDQRTVAFELRRAIGKLRTRRNVREVPV